MAVATDLFATDPSTRWTAVDASATWDSVDLEYVPDLTVTNPYGIRYTSSSPGSPEHEAQFTFKIGDSSSQSGVGGPGVRFANNGAADYYGVNVFWDANELQIFRSQGGTQTDVGLPFTIAALTTDEFISVRLAAAGAVGANVVLSVWLARHGTTKPADPDWIGVDGSPTFSRTDSDVDRLDGAEHTQCGMAGGAQGNQYDTRHDFYKQRAISDRAGSGTTIAIPAGAVSTVGRVAVLALAIVAPASARTFTGYAPAVISPRTVAVPAGSVSVTGYAPTLARMITVPTGSATVTGYAGALAIGRVIAVPAGSVAATGYAPVLARTIAPPAGSVTITGRTPTVIAPRTIPIPAGSLSVTGYTPALAFLGPDVGRVVITGYAPALAIGRAIAVPTGSVSVTGRAPTLATAIGLPAGSVTVTGYAPTIVAPKTIAIPVGSVTVSGAVPTLARSIAVPAGSLTATGYAATLATPKTIAVPAGSLTVTGYAAGVAFLGPDVGRVTITGYAPALSIGRAIAVPAGAVTVTGRAATVARGVAIPTGSVSIAGYAPTVLAPQLIAIPAGAVTITGYPATLVGSGAISPPSGAVAVTGYAPSLAFRVPAAAGSVSAVGYAASLLTTIPVPAGAAVFAGYAPQMVGAGTISPPSGVVAIAGYAPRLGFTVSVLPGSVQIVGAAATPLVETHDIVISIPAGSVVITGYAPTFRRPSRRIIVEVSPTYPVVVPVEDGMWTTQNIAFARGDNAPIEFPYTTPVSIAGRQTVFVMRRTKDAEQLAIEEPGEVIVAGSDTTPGRYRVTLPATKTSGLEARTYWYAFKCIDVGGEELIATGKCQVVADILNKL